MIRDILSEMSISSKPYSVTLTGASVKISAEGSLLLGLGYTVETSEKIYKISVPGVSIPIDLNHLPIIFSDDCDTYDIPSILSNNKTVPFFLPLIPHYISFDPSHSMPPYRLQPINNHIFSVETLKNKEKEDHDES